MHASNHQGTAAEMQLDDCTLESWTAAVEEVAAALQPCQDDIQPLSDAPNYQALCCRIHKVCSQAADSTTTCLSTSSYSTSSSSQPVSALTPKALNCLHQLSAATMQLATAICCEADVALPLIAVGAHTAALEQLKGAVKALITHLITCMDLIQKRQQQAHAGTARDSHSSTSQDKVLQDLLPALAVAAQHLLHMAVTSAAFITSSSGSDGSASSSSQQVPREMCSMSALNLSWSNLTRLLVAMPEEARMQMLQTEELSRGLCCALQQLQAAFNDLPVQAKERQEVLVRFWLQSVSRLTSAVWGDAAQQALLPLLQVTMEVYDAVSQQRDGFADVRDILQQLLQPRLLACLSSLLSRSTDAAATQAKLDLLLQHTTASTPQQLQQQQPGTSMALDASNSDDRRQQQHQQQMLKAHLLVVLDLLQGFVPNWPVEIVAQGCKQMLIWVISTTGSSLAPTVLDVFGGNPPPCTASLASSLSQQGAAAMGTDDGGGGVLGLLQEVLQGSLVGLLACWAVLQHAQQQQQQLELLVGVNRLALSAHPLVSFLARQLLADLSACSSNDSSTTNSLAEQELVILHRLLSAASAAAAVPGAGCLASNSTEAVVDTLATILQVCDEGLVGAWSRQHLFSSLSHSSCNETSSSSSYDPCSWLDAVACCQLASECSTLLQLPPPTLSAVLPISHDQLQEGWTQLWSTAQQLVELLDPKQVRHINQLQQQQQQQGMDNDSSWLTQQAAEQLLVLHHLTWLLEAMQGLMQLMNILDAPTACNLSQGGTAFALDLLTALEQSSSSTGSSADISGSAGGDGPVATAVVPAQYACTTAALKLLAAAGQLQVSEGQVPGVLQLMMGLANKHAGLRALLAAVCGNLAVAARLGHPQFQELFQLLLSSSHWAVRHAAFEGLLQLLRQNSLGNNIVKLLPSGMRSTATEATPDVISIVKAHLHKQPDSQAQQSFQQHYQQLGLQHTQQLAAAFGSPSSSSTFRTCFDSDTTIGASSGASSNSSNSNVLKGIQELECWLGACSVPAEGVTGPSGTTGGLLSPQGTVGGDGGAAAATAAAGMAGAQSLLAQATAAGRSLKAAGKALSQAEADVQLLLTAATAAARDQALGADGILAISKQGASLMGNCASMISRLRALQDGLATLRG